MLEGSVEDDVCEFHAESWATRGRVTHVHQQVVEYHTCLQWKAKFAGFFLFLLFIKPNQAESKHHPYTSAGGGRSHMRAMKSKIRGFSSFYQTKPTGRVTYVHQQVVEYHTCLQWKAKFADFSHFTKPNRQGASHMYISRWEYHTRLQWKAKFAGFLHFY